MKLFNIVHSTLHDLLDSAENIILDTPKTIKEGAETLTQKAAACLSEKEGEDVAQRGHH